MSLAVRVNALAARIRDEFNDVRTELAAAGGSTVKVSALTLLAPTAASFDDEYPIVDKSDTTQAATGSTKKTKNPFLLLKGSSLTNSTVTPANITGLSFPVIAGRAYKFDFTGVFQTAATTTGLGLNFTGPACTLMSWLARMQQAANGTDSYFEGTVVTTAAAMATTRVVSTAVLAANTNYQFTVSGLIIPSADGTVQLQGSSEVGGSNAIIAAGTVGIVIDLG